MNRTYTLSVIIVMLMAASPAKAGAAGGSPSLVKRYLLEDFDGPRIPGRAWYTYPRAQGSGVRFRLDSTDRREGNALHLRYTFASQRPTEIGFRLPLPGLDASEYDHLSFWVKGDRQTGYSKSFRVEFQRPEPDAPPEFFERGSFVVEGVRDDWRQVVVPLNFMTGIRDWTRLTSFVISFHSRRSPILHGAYLIDDIALLKTGNPGPSIHDKVIPFKKKAWEAARGGEAAARPHIQARLAGWPGRFLVDRKTLPKTDQEFLLRLARDTWRGLDAFRDRENGLPIDNVRFGQGSVDPARAFVGDYANVTNIGLQLISVAAARELGFISREEALERLRLTLSALERLETHRGFFYNYYDTTTLERTSHFISFVDSAWLTAGLMVTRMGFPELYQHCTRLIAQGDYGFFYDPVEQHMSHGYYVNLPARAEYRYGALYAESRLGSLIAIGKGDAPEEHWFRLVRTFPREYTWQTQPPLEQRPKPVRTHELTGGHYRWRGVNFIPSWGGSLFEALMPALVLDELRHAPKSLGQNGAAHADIQRRYATEELHYPVWGLSPSATSDGLGYSEYGVKVLGSRGYQAGVVTPHASALALGVTPQAATDNLRKLAERYPIYGDYGLYDAVDPTTGQVAPKYVYLDQAMTFIALANHLKDHAVQQLFAADPITQKALPVLQDENFFD